MIDKLPKLRKLAEQHGLEIVLRQHGHVQVRGGAMTVNWYPSSKRRTAYCNGSVAGVPCDGPEQVIAMALGEQEPSMAHVARRASYKSQRLRMWKKTPSCHWCARTLVFSQSTVDHIIPLARGGANTTDNLVLSCQPCNHGRGDDLPKVAS